MGNHVKVCMNFIRAKILVVLLLFANVTIPMKLPSFHMRGDKDASEILLIFENCMSLASLTFQAASFAWLKKNNALFGTELIPKKINILGCCSIRPKNVLAAGVFYGLPLTFLFSFINTMFEGCIHSDVNTGINTLLLTSSMTHASNLMYDDALKLLRKEFKKVRPEIIIKNMGADFQIYQLLSSIKTDSPFHIPHELVQKIALNVRGIETLDNVRCVICYEYTLDREYVNPCNQKDHIFCKDCLMSCFANQKVKPSFMSKDSFLCELCRKEVPFNNEKFEVILSPQPKVTLDLRIKQMGFMVIFYGIGLYVLMQILQCQFS